MSLMTETAAPHQPLAGISGAESLVALIASAFMVAQRAAADIDHRPATAETAADIFRRHFL